jgi:hypothetical protein
MPRFQPGHQKVGGRKKGAYYAKALVHPDALIHLAETVASKDPNVTPDLKVRAAAALAQYQHPRPTASKQPFFTPKPFAFTRPTTLEEAGTETLRVAEVVALGELDHDTGTFVISALRTFIEAVVGIKTEREIALADLAKGSGAGNGNGSHYPLPPSPLWGSDGRP